VLMVQLLIIAVVPSKAPRSGETLAATGGGGVAGAETNGIDPATGAPLAADGAGGATGAGTASGGAGAGRAAGAGATAAAGAQGDVSHCVGGRQFDPALDYYAPPCVPRSNGKNPGATYQGVTADTITLVDYYDKGNDAVNAILKATNAYVSYDQQKAFDQAAAKFINDHYELYGRKVKVETVQGTCQSIPPDLKCLRPEMDQIVKDKHPYFVKWNTSLCSACYDELSQLKTPNAGGWHFRDQFSLARRPYHWDEMMSGTTMAKAFGQYWCASLAKKPAKWAGTQNPADSINGRQRLLGVISTNDPENEDSIKKDLMPELAKCGDSVGDRQYYYEQNINTVETQRVQAVGKMRGNGTPGSEATTVVCFCDLVAPQFLYQEEQNENYWPENIMPGSGLMDRDPSAQDYEGSVACPNSAQGCEYDLAFGLSSISNPEKENADVGTRVWHAAGMSGNTPAPSQAISHDWEYWSLIATLIQASGPTLTPQNMDAGVRQYGVRGGGSTGHVLRGFPPGSYAWNQDMRQVYFSKTKPSPYNGTAGTYVSVGDRITLGGYKPGDPPIPAQR
ncbi:MAG: hypothetical protein QOJ09_848, partial [Actinomycetota bacterium]|nr:hypothetical protein [Actinomycetota bacterium]